LERHGSGVLLPLEHVTSPLACGRGEQSLLVPPSERFDGAGTFPARRLAAFESPRLCALLSPNLSRSSADAALRKSSRMLSAAKLAANRANSLRSSGPRTIAGSRASSTNATRHGLSATSVVVIRGVENETDYEALVADVIADLRPVGAVETLLVERVAQLFWRLQRVLRFETERLSQQSCEAASSCVTLEETVKDGALRERFCSALGHLFLPEASELEPETVGTIFEAFRDCQSEAQRRVFRETEHGWLSAVREPGARVTVGDVLRFLRAAEERLQALGPVALGSPVSPLEKPQPNLIATVYSYYLGTERLWSRFDGEAIRGFDRRITDALLLQLGAVGLVDRYEPRLRKDLTNTLRDLADLQDRRRRWRRGTAAAEERLTIAAIPQR